MPSEILLFSAGLDSFPAWHFLDRPPALHFDIRHHFRDQELAAVRDVAGRSGMDLAISSELDLSAWDTPQGDLIPFRNVLLAMLAALRADVVWIAGVKGDYAADKSPEAFARMSEMLTAFAGRQVRVDSPFWGLTKTGIVAWYLRQGLPAADLLATFSCLTPGTAMEHCGQCPSCLRRWIALANNGLPGRFAADPWRWERVSSYYVPAMRDGTYPPHRAEEFFQALSSVGLPV